MSAVDTALRAADIAIRVLPSMVRWIKAQLDGGYDAEAELQTMFAVGDATAEERQLRKFGPRK